MSHHIFQRKTQEEILYELKSSPTLFHRYLSMDEVTRQRFMDFCTGKKTLPVLYDTIFKRLMHPDLHPERLESCLSSLLNISVKIHAVLPLENVLMDGESILTMDILVQLEDGAYVLVEVQKVPYYFPAERASCYSSDLLLRQYSRLKRELGVQFSYRDLHKVYTIVFYEKTSDAFKAHEHTFIHHAKMVCNTGLNLNFLQEYYLIALDVFRKSEYSKHKDPKNTLIGWLSFFCTETIEDAESLCQIYPWLSDIYTEMAQFGRNPKELIGMFSEMLREMDRNTVRYMIDDMNEKLEQQKLLLAENEKTLAAQEQTLAVQEQTLAVQEQTLAAQEQTLAAQEQTLAAQAAEIKRLQSLLTEARKD